MVRDVKRDMIAFPGIVANIRRAADKYWERQTEGGKKFKTADAFWEWWLDRDRVNVSDVQCLMFDSGEDNE